MLQDQIDGAVKTLLSLKVDYKAATGQDWKPGCVPPPVAEPAKQGGADVGGLNQKITDQGNKVRQLKGDKAPKVDERSCNKCYP